MQGLWALIPQPKFLIPQTKIPHAVWHSQKQNKQKYARTAPGTQRNILGIIFTYKKM
jgi:hypothetical protein